MKCPRGKILDKKKKKCMTWKSKGYTKVVGIDKRKVFYRKGRNYYKLKNEKMQFEFSELY